MVPDLPNVKRKISQVMKAFLIQKMRAEPSAVKRVSQKNIYEGNRFVSQHNNGSVTETEMRNVQASLTLSKDELLNLSPNDLMTKMEDLSKSMVSQMDKGLFEQINKDLTASNRTFSAEGGLTPDSLLEAMRRVKIDFEDDDINKPRMPTIFAAPDTVEKFKMTIQKLTPDELNKFMGKQNEIIKVKYKEHLADLQNRQLIID